MASYTKLTESVVNQILNQYDVGELTNLTLLDGGLANSSCVIVTTKGKYVLSVCDEKNPQEISSLTALLAHLQTSAFCTPEVVPLISGENYCLYYEKPVYLKRYIAGEMGGTPTPAKIAQVGEALARLHQIPAPDFIPQQLTMGVDDFEALIGRNDNYSPWLAQKRGLIVPYLSDDLPQGLVHGDLFWDNMLFEQDKLVAMLDFEEVCKSYLIFDLGMCAVGCCRHQNLLDETLFNALVKGYQRVRQLTEKEQQALPIFIVYAATVTSFWRYRQFNIVRPDATKKDHYLVMSNFADSVVDSML